MRPNKIFINYISCLSFLLIYNGYGITSNLAQNDHGFHFILKYGIGGKNILNTFDGTYTKDMIVEPSFKTKLSLSKEELNTIKNEMEEIKIFGYPEEYSPRENDGPPSDIVSLNEPHSTYYFKIRIGDKVKEIFWVDSNGSIARKAIKLRSLIRRIQKMIVGKEEYKKLPPTKGGYL